MLLAAMVARLELMSMLTSALPLSGGRANSW